MSIFFISGPELEEQKLLILRKEIQLHVCLSGLTHEADQLKLQRCLRSQLKSSAEAAIILEQSRALQVIMAIPVMAFSREGYKIRGQIKKIRALHTTSWKLEYFTLLHYFFDLTSFYRLGKKYKNIFVRFLVQMKILKSPFKIN